MPWRGEKDSYKVLVSEIMLQQTQVSRVLIKYKEFLKAFPTLKKLSKSSLGDVLKAWQGLGYNRRARFLHTFAKEVVANHNGKIPQEREVLLTLPGIGKATAGSLSAFAFNLPVPFIETNIRRVYIHHFFKNKADVTDAEILPLVVQTLDIVSPREWYYALMDYGSEVSKKIVNPNRKSKHYTKQSKFEGSNREVRGAILKIAMKEEALTKVKLIKLLSFEQKRIETALAGLLAEGLMVEKKGGIVLP